MNLRHMTFLALPVALSAACSNEPAEQDADAALDGDADAGGDADADVDPDACTPDRMCYADFPCRDESFCRDDRTVVGCVNVHCASPRVCGTSCCSGGTCLPSLDPPTTCADGEWCFEHPAGEPPGFIDNPGRTARCLPDPAADVGDAAAVDYEGYTRPEVFEPYCR